jgi:NodT family efflux transporter outer membrane factor (OMF) lipoprotein
MKLIQNNVSIGGLLRHLWMPISLILAGCAAVGPDYVKPDIAIPTAFNAQAQLKGESVEMDPRTLAEWWTTLNDTALSTLIDRAVVGNLDLKRAQARVREAHAQRGISNAGRYPTLDATASAQWSRMSEDNGSGKTTDSYTASIDASWELDIFGGVRRSVAAAEADLQASQEDLRDVLVSLLGEVALNYVDLRTLQARLSAAEANLEAQSETYKLAQWRYQAGLGDELAVQQSLYNLENTRSQIPTLRSWIEEAMNRIAVLLGEEPGKVHQELDKQTAIPMPSIELAFGVPADLLRRRPDVRRAERQLAAQTMRIGVATADLYPKLTLNGSIGLEAISSNKLTSSGIWTFNIGPRIEWAIFKGGAIRRNIEVQSALQEQALIQYEASVLGALEEVENAIVAYAQEQLRRQSLNEATVAARNAAELAQYKYQAGLTDFGAVLDAHRSLLSFQNQLAQSEGTQISNLVRMYKALGGGWAFMSSDRAK